MCFVVEGEEPSPLLAPDRAIALYRIAQEAFTNAAKHSGGSLVQARLMQEAGRVGLVITDDGRWVPPPDAGSRSAGLGLTTMRERAEAIGATLEVRSSPDGGTVVTVRLEGNLEEPAQDTA